MGFHTRHRFYGSITLAFRILWVQECIRWQVSPQRPLWEAPLTFKTASRRGVDRICRAWVRRTHRDNLPWRLMKVEVDTGHQADLQAGVGRWTVACFPACWVQTEQVNIRVHIVAAGIIDQYEKCGGFNYLCEPYTLENTYMISMTSPIGLHMSVFRVSIWGICTQSNPSGLLRSLFFPQSVSCPLEYSDEIVIICSRTDRYHACSLIIVMWTHHRNRRHAQRKYHFFKSIPKMRPFFGVFCDKYLRKELRLRWNMFLGSMLENVFMFSIMEEQYFF